MTTPVTAAAFTDPAPAWRLERAAAALTAHGFTVEVLDAAAAARARVKDLIPEGAEAPSCCSAKPSDSDTAPDSAELEKGPRHGN